jgi:hypothetical protein
VPDSCGSRPQLAHGPGEGRIELDYPTPDRLVRDLEPPLGEERLDISIAEGEPEIEPDGVPDDIWRELVTGIGDELHSFVGKPKASAFS